MIIVQEIDKAIEDLEQKEQSFSVIEKLAWLYIVRDHNSNVESPALIRFAEPHEEENPVEYTTEFGQLASQMSMGDLLPIMEKHMEAIQVLYPKEYDKILSQIRDML